MRVAMQALLANISAMYAVYHGPAGLAEIATRVHHATLLLAKGLREAGNIIENTGPVFDTLKVNMALNCFSKPWQIL